MSISGSLNNALSGMAAASRMAEVVSSNLSNALTEGYGRRDVSLTAVSVGGRGAGVQVTSVNRYVDPGVLGDRRIADAELNNQQGRNATLARVETLIGVPGDLSGLTERLVGFESALVSASADPSSNQRLSVAVTKLGDLTDKLNETTRSLQIMRQDADATIAQEITQLNSSLSQIEQLNAEIQRARSIGGDPSALQDARQLAIDTVAGIVPVREVDRDNGVIALFTPSGEILLDGKPAVYEFTRTPTITADMTFAAGSLGGISRNGTPLSLTDGIGRMSGGSLEAAFATRDEIVVEAQRGLDVLAADLIQRFEDVSNDPSLAAGDPGLLTDRNAAYNPLLIDGLAGRISINANVDPDAGGLATRLRDGVGSTAVGPTGDSTQIERWLAALDQQRTPFGGSPTLSASGQFAHLNDTIGTQRIVSDDDMMFAAARWDTLKTAELADGVDTDQELQKLLQIEQAYSANAKLIQTASAMLQTLMEI